MDTIPQNFPAPRNNRQNIPNTPLDSRAFMPAYIRARQRWGRVYDERLLPLLSNQQNPTLPSFSLNAPLGSDFQNYYPQLYNTEKSALATVLGTLNPIGTPNSAFRQWQLNDDILLTSNVNSIEYSLLIDKDNPNLISWAIQFSQSGYIYFLVAPIGSNQLESIATMDTSGNFEAGNAPTPIPQIGGYTIPGTYAFDFPVSCKWARVYVTGGGGAGGTGYRGYSAGGGGASGGTVISVFEVDPLTMNPCTATVGGGGAYNTQEGGAGFNGGPSYFATADLSIDISAQGGFGASGGGAISGNGGQQVVPAGTGGVFLFPGNAGETGQYVVFPNYDTYSGGGNGGGSYWGGAGKGGGALANQVVQGNSGWSGGGGGGGPCAQVTGYPAGYNYGGPGGAGVVMIEMYG